MYIRVEGQGLINFTLKTNNISGDIPDTLGERVPHIIGSPGERVISSLPRSTSRRENRSVTYVSKSAIHSKKSTCVYYYWKCLGPDF